MTAYTESAERQELRKAVAQLGAKYGAKYVLEKARNDERTTDLWLEAGRLGYLGVAIPEEYGGGGGDLGDLAAVGEELAASGAPLLMTVVSPAIVGTTIAEFGTEEQKRRWLPGIADGTLVSAFAITEPDAGSNSHRIVTTATKQPDGSWRLSGHKTFISGVDEAQYILVVGRTSDAKTGALRPALFLVPTDADGLTFQRIDMGIVSAEKQFTLFLDDIHLPADALIGEEDAAMAQLFAGLIPERIMAGAFAIGLGRFAMNKAVQYAQGRKVFGDTPIGAHQAIAHPLAKSHIELELARLMLQKAAALHAAGDHLGSGEAANMAKYAAAEAAISALENAIQTHGGNGLAEEYELVQLLGPALLMRVAPVSREMILNYVAQFSLGLPKSY